MVGALGIPREEVEFHPLSFADPGGRLFWWGHELYRGISQERAALCTRMFGEGIVQKLVQRGLLVGTELTSLEMEGYALIVKHHPVKFVSYPYEWCPVMLRDAALLVVSLEIELAKEGLTLQDAHPWNVVFDGSRPIYVDLGSIVPAPVDAPWAAYDEFCRFFLSPLSLIRHGHGRMATWLLHDDQGVLQADLDALIRGRTVGGRVRRAITKSRSVAKQSIPSPLRALLKRGLTRFGPSLRTRTVSTALSRASFLLKLQRDLETVDLPSRTTEWSAYYEGYFPNFSPSGDWTAKHHSVYKVLSDLRPDSVLDIGSNRGWYSQLAASLGSNVVAFDVDDRCVAKLYEDAKERNLPILPLVMDFRNPSRGYGLSGQWRNQRLVSAMQRLRCELVMGLALVHHLVFKQHLNFEQIIDGLSEFSARWLLVEFIPQEDEYVRDWGSDESSWYTLDRFIIALKRKFHDVRVFPSDPASRVLLLCEK